jgi:hypothetical protein
MTNFQFKDNHGFRIESITEFAPSAGWLCLMWLPLVFQYAEMHPTGRALQITLVTSIAIFLLLADGFCFMNARNRECIYSHKSIRGVLDLVGMFFLFLAMLHLYLMPKIPLLILIFDDAATQSSLMLLRHSSAKLLDIPPIVKYLFNWILVVLAPVYICAAFFAKHCFRAICGLFLAGLYAAATLAKFPLIMLMITCFFTLCSMPTRFRRILSFALAAALLICVLLTTIFLYSDSSNFIKVNPPHGEAAAFGEMSADDPRRALTYGDNLRLESNEIAHQRSKSLNIATYAIYRIWLTPADVSNRWYQYFTYVKKEPLGLQGFLPSRDVSIVAPSREVGIWAYQARFPTRYTDAINANASFDTDAFARYGISGVVIATVMLLLVRIGASFLVTSHTLSLAGYGVLLCGLAILPSSASLQAIFGAQGLFIIFVGLVIIRLQENLSTKKCHSP